MQDFTKTDADLKNPTAPVPNTFGGIYEKHPASLKQGFIAARLNKDNFWNLMFAFGMFFGALISGILVQQALLGAFISSWSTILGVPFILKKFNKTTFIKAENNKGGRFFNRQGEDITDRVPNTLFWPVLLTFVTTVLTGLLLDNHGKNVPEEPAAVIIFFIIFFTPVLYFIIINCPISILFSLDTWKVKRTDVEFIPPKRDPFTSSADLYSPSRSNLLCNSWHRSRH